MRTNIPRSLMRARVESRHNVESFLLVVLYICVIYNRLAPSASDRLHWPFNQWKCYIYITMHVRTGTSHENTWPVYMYHRALQAPYAALSVISFNTISCQIIFAVFLNSLTPLSLELCLGRVCAGRSARGLGSLALGRGCGRGSSCLTYTGLGIMGRSS